MQLSARVLTSSGFGKKRLVRMQRSLARFYRLDFFYNSGSAKLNAFPGQIFHNFYVTTEMSFFNPQVPFLISVTDDNRLLFKVPKIG